MLGYSSILNDVYYASEVKGVSYLNYKKQQHSYVYLFSDQVKENPQAISGSRGQQKFLPNHFFLSMSVKIG